MNKLIIIGNGFDLAHGLKTKYSDMIDFFWENLIDKCNELAKIHSPYFQSHEDDLISIIQTSRCNIDFRELRNRLNLNDTLVYINRYFKFKVKDNFLKLLIDKNNIQNWVDVENEYYQYLLSYLDKTTKKIGYESYANNLNKSLDLIKDLLSRHLLNEMLKPTDKNNKIFNHFLSSPSKEEVIYERGLNLSAYNTLIVNFNYTDTIEKLYLEKLKLHTSASRRYLDIIHIHGFIENFESNPMIFGYGDELDKHSKIIVDLNDSEFLKNIKSINYQFTSNYKKILNFLSENKFQTVIMGHSCGNSDRTLLNTIFEHKNCISIKPYYHKWDGGDNYFDTVCNIYRNFTKNSSFREKVVEKNLCETLT